jgi:hypothetical protein
MTDLTVNEIEFPSVSLKLGSIRMKTPEDVQCAEIMLLGTARGDNRTYVVL